MTFLLDLFTDLSYYLGQMYPVELEIKDTTESNTSASYLDLLLSIGRDGQLHTSIHDKRDDFNFHITNFPFLSSNIPTSPAYGVFISQLIRYARACSSYGCFILRATRLSNKLLELGYVKERLKSWLRKFYGRYGDLIKQYEVYLSQMLNDILWPDHIQWQPPTDQTVYRTRPFTEFWVVSINICDGCGMPTGEAYSSGHLVPSLLGFAYVLLIETNPFLNLSLFYRTMLFDYPSVLSRFCLITNFDIITQYKRFPNIVCNACGMPTGDAYSSGHLLPSNLGLTYVLLVEFPNLSLLFFSDDALRTSLGNFSNLPTHTSYLFVVVL